MIEHAELWARRDTDPKAREALIGRYSYLVGATCSRVLRRAAFHIARGDLEGCGFFALVRAVDAFAPDRGVQFPTYAIALIWGAMLEHPRRDDWVPRSVRGKQKLLAQIERTGVVPAGVDLETLRQGAFEVEIRSLDYEFRAGRDSEALPLQEVLPDPAPGPEALACLSENARMLAWAVARLPFRERYVIQRYYADEVVQPVIAQELQRSESRVHQLRLQALERLRRMLEVSYGA